MEDVKIYKYLILDDEFLILEYRATKITTHFGKVLYRIHDASKSCISETFIGMLLKNKTSMYSLDRNSAGSFLNQVYEYRRNHSKTLKDSYDKSLHDLDVIFEIIKNNTEYGTFENVLKSTPLDLTEPVIINVDGSEIFNGYITSIPDEDLHALYDYTCINVNKQVFYLKSK